MKKQILLAFIFISSVFCGMLTTEEDEHRAKTCGRVGNLKGNTSHHQAPWVHQFMVQRTFGSQDATFWAAFFISPRHVLVQSKHLISSAVEGVITPIVNDLKWLYTTTRLEVDVSQCRDNVITFSEEHRKGLMVQLICEGGDCGGKDRRLVNVKSVHYFGNCELGVPAEGIVLAEIEEPVPLTPICPAGKSTRIEVGDEVVEHYTEGLSTSGVEFENKSISYQKCVAPVQEKFLCVKNVKSPCVGGFVRKINGIDTLLSVNLLSFDNNKPDFALSVAFFQDKICLHSGVCKETIATKIEPSPTADGVVGDVGDGSENCSSIVFGAFELLTLISILVSV